MRSRHRGVPVFLSSLIVLVLAAVDPARAQAHDSSWVRIRVAQGRWHRKLVGQVRDVTADSIVLMQEKRGPVSISRKHVESFEQWSGTKSASGRDALRGLGYGAGIGVLGGVVAGAAASGDCSGGFDMGPGCAPGLWMVAGAVAGGLLGTFVGAVIGAGQQMDRWSPMAMPPQPALILKPGRIGLSLPIRLPVSSIGPRLRDS